MTSVFFFLNWKQKGENVQESELYFNIYTYVINLGYYFPEILFELSKKIAS